MYLVLRGQSLVQFSFHVVDQSIDNVALFDGHLQFDHESSLGSRFHLLVCGLHPARLR